MKYCLLLLAVVLFFSGCASTVKTPRTIQGHRPGDVVLYASQEIQTRGMRLPRGYYYPLWERETPEIFMRARHEYFHPAGVLGRNIIGQWINVPGGISVAYDPGEKTLQPFVRAEGVAAFPGPIPAGAIQVIERPGASNSREADILNEQISALHQQEMYNRGRKAGIQGAMMAAPTIR